MLDPSLVRTSMQTFLSDKSLLHCFVNMSVNHACEKRTALVSERTYRKSSNKPPGGLIRFWATWMGDLLERGGGGLFKIL